MAIPKRRNQADHDSPAAKKLRTNTTFASKDFMEDFMADFPLQPENGPTGNEDDPPLPSTVLTNEELQGGSERKPPRRSTFNIKLPIQLKDQNDASAQNTPFDWMKKQYAHCIVPELGEEYDFAFDSPTFHCLRDLHNARVRMRDGEYLPDYLVCSLATRWVSLEEKDRPASDGYLANGDIFVATCLPISDVDDSLEKYFEGNYSTELSAQYYIPRSKYTVHFVGEPILTESDEIQAVKVGSVLIRNTRTGDVIHIDTGALTGRKARGRDAGQVLKAWLEFQETKSPKANLGPISNSEPFILDVDKETHPTLRSYHALVSASLFLRRRVTNWGDVKAFKLRGSPSSITLADYALRNISGWLGIKSPAKKPGEKRSKKPTRIENSFEINYKTGALFGRKIPAPVSQRITSVQKGEPPVYNEETRLDDDSSDHEHSHTDSSIASSHNGVDSDQETVVVDESSISEEALDDEVSDNEVFNDNESVNNKSIHSKEPVDKELNQEEHNNEDLNREDHNQENHNSKEPGGNGSNHDGSNGDDPSHEDLNNENSSSESTTDGDENDNQAPSVPT